MVLVTILTIFFTIVAAALVLIVLVQRPQGGGLSGAFGGAGGGSDTVFGGRTGDALTVSTVVAFVLFLSLSIALNVIDLKALNSGGNATPASDVQPADTGATTDGTQLPSTGIPIGTSTSPSGTPSRPTLTPIDGPPPGLTPQLPSTSPALDPTGTNGTSSPAGQPE